MLAGFGVPGAFAEIIADSDLGIARGDLLVSSGDLRKLIGRPATSWLRLFGLLRPLTRSASRTSRSCSCDDGGGASRRRHSVRVKR